MKKKSVIYYEYITTHILRTCIFTTFDVRYAKTHAMVKRFVTYQLDQNISVTKCAHYFMHMCTKCGTM